MKRGLEAVKKEKMRGDEAFKISCSFCVNSYFVKNSLKKIWGFWCVKKWLKDKNLGR